MDVYTLAIDLKIKPDGDIRILEIMSSNYAGFKGYKASTGKSMLEDAIFPDLEGLGRSFHYMEAGSNYEDAIEFLDRKAPHGGGILYLPQGYLIHDRRRTEAKESFHAHINADLNFLVLADNKAAFHHVTDDIAEQLHLPPTYIGASTYRKDLVQDIRDKIGEHSRYILKAPNTSNGTGLRLIEGADLDDALKGMFPAEGQNTLATYKKPDGIRRFSDYWVNKPAPVFIIQPCIYGKSLEKDGQLYDGTMRVTLTAYRYGKGRPFHIVPHDGYWKLPLDPVDDTKAARSIISYSYGNKESRNKPPGFLKRLFNSCAGDGYHLSKNTYMAVDRDDLELVFAKMVDVVPEMMTQVCDTEIRQVTKDWLYSDDKMLSGLGTMLALDGHYAPFRFEEDLPGEKGYLCEEKNIMDELITRFRSAKCTAGNRYMEAFIDRVLAKNDYYKISLPRKLLMEIQKERAERFKMENLSSILRDLHGP